MTAAYDMADLIDRLAEIIIKANYVIAFTGAGVSTESGIPDFRSKGRGLWEKIDPGLLSAETLMADPALFYRCFLAIDKTVKGKLPNSGHRALAVLDKLGIVKTVITQNIDGLHQLAGSGRVLEVHGNLQRCRCMTCGTEYPSILLREQLARKKIPTSPCCGAVLRPNVVLFGDKMAADFQVAREEASKSDFAIAIGTSLTVYPAACIPLEAGRFAIINREETPQDRHAVMVIKGSVGQVLTTLVERVQMRLKYNEL